MDKQAPRKEPSRTKSTSVLQRLGSIIFPSGESSSSSSREHKVAPEFVINDHTIKIGKEVPMEVRLKFTDDFCQLISQFSIDNLNLVWNPVSDLVEPSNSLAVQRHGLKIMETIIQNQSSNIKSHMRLEFIKVISRVKEISQAVHQLDLLTRSGRDLSPFEMEIFKILLRWIETVKSNLPNQTAPYREATAVVHFASQIARNSFSLIPGKMGERLTMQIADLSVNSMSPIVLKESIGYLGQLMRFSPVLSDCTPCIISMLCHAVTFEDVCSDSIALFDTFLQSYGYQAIMALCVVLNQSFDQPPTLLIGAIYFVGRSVWGKNSSNLTLEIEYLHIVPCLNRVAQQSTDPKVHKEILLSLKRLVEKYGHVLYEEWTIIVEMVRAISISVHNKRLPKPSSPIGSQERKTQHSNTPSTLKSLSDLSSNSSTSSNDNDNSSRLEEQKGEKDVYLEIEQLIQAFSCSVDGLITDHTFLGSVDQVYDVLESFASLLKDATLRHTFSNRLKQIHPVIKEWKNNLQRLLKSFFIRSIAATTRADLLSRLEDETTRFFALSLDEDELSATLVTFLENQINYCKLEPLMLIKCYRFCFRLFERLPPDTLHLDQKDTRIFSVIKAIVQSKANAHYPEVISSLNEMIQSFFRNKWLTNETTKIKFMIALIFEGCLSSAPEVRAMFYDLGFSFSSDSHQSVLFDLVAQSSPFLQLKSFSSPSAFTSPSSSAPSSSLSLASRETLGSVGSHAASSILALSSNEYMINFSSFFRAIEKQLTNETSYENLLRILRGLRKLASNFFIFRSCKLLDLIQTICQGLEKNTIGSRITRALSEIQLLQIEMNGLSLLASLSGLSELIPLELYQQLIKCFIFHGLRMIAEPVVSGSFSFMPGIQTVERADIGSTENELLLSRETLTAMIRSICIRGITICIAEKPQLAQKYFSLIIRQLPLEVEDAVATAFSDFSELLTGLVFGIDCTSFSNQTIEEKDRTVSLLICLLKHKPPVSETSSLLNNGVFRLLARLLLKCNGKDRLSVFRLIQAKLEAESPLMGANPAFIDLLYHVISSDCRLVPLIEERSEQLSLVFSAPVIHHWIQGHNLITAKLGFLGWTEITLRKPSATITWWMQLQNSMPSSFEEFERFVYPLPELPFFNSPPVVLPEISPQLSDSIELTFQRASMSHSFHHSGTTDQEPQLSPSIFERNEDLDYSGEHHSLTFSTNHLKNPGQRVVEGGKSAKISCSSAKSSRRTKRSFSEMVKTEIERPLSSSGGDNSSRRKSTDDHLEVYSQHLMLMGPLSTSNSDDSDNEKVAVNFQESGCERDDLLLLSPVRFREQRSINFEATRETTQLSISLSASPSPPDRCHCTSLLKEQVHAKKDFAIPHPKTLAPYQCPTIDFQQEQEREEEQQKQEQQEKKEQQKEEEEEEEEEEEGEEIPIHKGERRSKKPQQVPDDTFHSPNELPLTLSTSLRSYESQDEYLYLPSTPLDFSSPFGSQSRSSKSSIESGSSFTLASQTSFGSHHCGSDSEDQKAADQASEEKQENQELKLTSDLTMIEPKVQEPSNAIAAFPIDTLSESQLNGETLTSTVKNTGENQTVSTAPVKILEDDLFNLPQSPTSPTSPILSNSVAFSQNAAIHPSFFLLQMPYLNMNGPLIEVAASNGLDRAIKVFDMMSPYDTCKFAVLYVGPGQSTEEQILANRCGSMAYEKFLSLLGDYYSHAECVHRKLFLAGQNSAEEYGKILLHWSDAISQITFHVATLMPCETMNKKQLIGNDFVHIVFNESGSDYNINTFSGQFNLGHIIVSPLPTTNYYSLIVKRKNDQPPSFSQSIIVSHSALGFVVRELAVSTEIECRVTTAKFLLTNREGRYKQLQNIIERFAGKE